MERRRLGKKCPASEPGKRKNENGRIYAGVTVAAALVVTLLQLALAEGIGQTSGLSGLGTRSVLQTAGAVLQIANAVLAPFWKLGFLFVALVWSREQAARTGDLLAGFQRFGVYLRLLILKGILLFCILMLCAYVSSFLFMATPWALPVMEFAQSAGMDMNAANELMLQMDEAAMASLMGAMTPMLIIWGVLSVIVLIPMLYRFRMAEFMILEDRRVGAMAALLLSARLLHKRRWKLFILDLRFWWYYALEVGCMLLYSIDFFLPAGDLVRSLGLYILYLAALFALHTLLRPRVDTAYALAFGQLLQLQPVQPKPKAAPKNLPWDEQIPQ